VKEGAIESIVTSGLRIALVCYASLSSSSSCRRGLKSRCLRRFSKAEVILFENHKVPLVTFQVWYAWIEK